MKQIVTQVCTIIFVPPCSESESRAAAVPQSFFVRRTTRAAPKIKFDGGLALDWKFPDLFYLVFGEVVKKCL